MRLTELSGWQGLIDKSRHLADQHLSELLDDETRQVALSFNSLNKFHLDFSKQRLTADVMTDLIELAREAGLEDKIQALLSGAIVNPSENRPALHTALRAIDSGSAFVADDSVANAVNASLDKMAGIIERIQNGTWLGATGKPITDVVNIGVGGSDLGPLMSCFALAEYTDDNSTDIGIHFASSIDGSQLAEILPELNPETTLFCYVSKSFSTIDTLSNANTALAWLEAVSDDVTALKQAHFIGISTAPEKVSAWGIPEQNQILFWDWVGGRYSMWSAVGFTIALQIGMAGFKQFLAGAHAVDQHFSSTELAHNIPVLMGLVDVWNCNFLGINAHAILPYDGRLKHFPAYLGQLEMESNGKSVTHDGQGVNYRTCPILWGEIGPNAQHAFYQLLHQGTEPVNADFIVSKSRNIAMSDAVKTSFKEHHELNVANCLAQSRVLALGNQAMSDEQVQSSSVFQQYAGNQPSTTFVLDELTPYTLGSLVALYEHKVFVSSVLWDINPFDQWGVELGKQIAKQLQPLLQGADSSAVDSSTRSLLNQLTES
ncbi:MAG: glucose-6-phosphate isomerase [Gammaproteobacteria bacterium]